MIGMFGIREKVYGKMGTDEEITESKTLISLIQVIP